MATEKAISLCAELRDSLRRLFTTVSDVQFDTDGNAFLTATQGTLVAGQRAVLVKVTPLASIGLNSLGQTQATYAQHIMQMVMETGGSAHTVIPRIGDVLSVFDEVAARSCLVQLYLSTNGVAISTAAITGTPEATWDGPSLKYRVMANS